MFMFIASAITLLFQVLPAETQDFSITVSPFQALPLAATAYAIFYDEPGQYLYLTGVSWISIDGQPFSGSNDCFVSKLAMNGSRVWTRMVGGTGDDYGRAVIQNPVTADVYVVGTTTSPSVDAQGTLGYYDAMMVKYAANGTKIFSRLFGTNKYDGFYGALFDATGQQLIVTGERNNLITVSVHDLGNGTMLNQFPFPTGYWTFSIVSASSGSDCFVTGGASFSFDGEPYNNNNDVFLTKMNYSNGTRYWSRIWGSSSEDRGVNVQTDPSSHLVFVAGWTNGGAVNGQSSIGNVDGLLICTGDNGTYLWTLQYGSPAGTFAEALTIHRPSGTLFLGGHFNYSMGFVSTVAQNGTMLQFKVQNGTTRFSDMAFSSSYNVAYLAEYSGKFVTVEVPPLPPDNQASVITAARTLSPVTTTTPSIKQNFDTKISNVPTLTSLFSFPSAYSANTPTLTVTSTVTNDTMSPPLPNDNGSKASFAQKNLSVIIMAAAGSGGIVLVGVTVFSCCFMWRSRQRSKSFRRATSMISSDFSDTSDGMSTTFMTQTTSMGTLIRSSFELSLPGYLMFQGGSSFRITKHVAKGGGGIVSIADALNPKLATYGPTIIVKTFGSDYGTSLSAMSEREQESFNQEVSIMHYFREERHIAKMLGWSSAPAALLMKFYERGSLDGWIHGPDYKSKVYLLHFMLDISRAILAMHTAGFVHCDLKPQNVLVDTDEQGSLFCCLTDFGITQIVDETTLLVKDFRVSNLRGLSSSYASPEAFQRFRVRKSEGTLTADLVLKFDMYSLGMIMFELLKRGKPWESQE